MDEIKSKLSTLSHTAAELLTFFSSLPDPNLPVYPLWSAHDILAHVTFWHESFARNVQDLVLQRPLSPLDGTFPALNRMGVESMRNLPINAILQRFSSAQHILEQHITNPLVQLIPYRKDNIHTYTPVQHLELVNGHICRHLQDVQRAAKRAQHAARDSHFG